MNKTLSIIIILILALTLPTWAKEKKKGKEKVFLILKTKYNGKETLLYWIPSDKKLDYTYTVTRKKPSDKDEKIIQKSIKYLSLKAAKWQLGEDFDKFQMLLYPFSLVKDPVKRLQMYEQEENRLSALVFLSTFRQDVAQSIGLMYKDRSAKVNTYYQYTVTAYKDNKKQFSKTTLLKTTKRKLFPIKDLRAHKYSWGVAFTWSNFEKYDKYNLYRSDTKEQPFKKINKAPIVVQTHKNPDGSVGTSPYFYTDKNVTKDGKYVYYVKGLDSFGEESSRSNMVFGKLLVSKLPLPPVRPKTRFQKGHVIVKWYDIVNKNIKGYNIYRGFTYENVDTKLNKKPLTKNTFIDNSAQEGVSYFYALSIVSKEGFESKKSLVSMIAPLDTLVPTCPTKLKAKIKQGEVILTWGASTDENLAGYKVFVSMDKNAKEWKMLTFEPIKTTYYSDKKSKALSRHHYYYKVKAVDANYNESKFSNIVKTKLPDVTIPKEPVIKKALAYPNKIILEWNAVEVYDLAHYNVYKYKGKKLNKLNKKPLIKLTQFIDKTPNQGKNIYIITAVDSSGNESLKKTPITITGKDNTPVSITNFKTKREKNALLLSFKVKEKDYNGFEVYRKAGIEDRYYNISGFQKGKTYKDNSVDNKINYFYKIKAYDKRGNSIESNTIGVIYKNKK